MKPLKHSRPNVAVAALMLLAVFAVGCGSVRYPRTYMLDLDGRRPSRRRRDRCPWARWSFVTSRVPITCATAESCIGRRGRSRILRVSPVGDEPASDDHRLGRRPYSRA